MSEYKRLTERRGSLVIDKCGNCPNVNNPQGCTDKKCYEIMKNRLVELEDKIENRTLIDLPCKVGDTVWWVNGYRTVPRIEEYKILALTIAKDNKIYLRVEYGHFTFEVDELCFTKEQAEAKLKELQEEKNDKERVY